MTPNTTYTLGPPEPTLPCLAPTHICRFYNRTGCSNHMRSQHPQLVPDLQQQATSSNSKSIPSSPSRMSSPPTYTNMSLDSHSKSTGRGSDHDHNNHNDYNDHNSTDDYQHLNGSCNQSPGISNPESYDQDHDPAIPSINRTYHLIINGDFLILLLIFHVYSQFHF